MASLDEGIKRVWPDGVPTSLWNYDSMQGAPYQQPLPFMNIRPDWQFMLAFLGGILVISLFAWQRFRKRTFEPPAYDVHVLKELTPLQLRGAPAIRRAYALYVGSLLTIYTALTFFGGLIFSAVNAIPMAGLQVGITDSALTGTSWPLTLAFALAGFTPLLRPLELSEIWLRQQAHSWVGIPVRIKERTRALLVSLDKEIENDTKLKTRLDAVAKMLRPWASGHLMYPEVKARAAEKFVQLELMADMIRDKSTWPDIAIADDLRPLAERDAHEAKSILENFEAIVGSDFDQLNRKKVGVKPHQGDNRLQSEPSDDEALAKHRQQLEAKLDDALAKIDQSRDELGAILAVYADRDKDYDTISNSIFQNAIRRAFPEEIQIDFGFWIPILLIPVFLIYVLMTKLGLHSLLTDTQTNAFTVLMTAVMETFHIAALLFFPILAVLLWRHYRIESGNWYSAIGVSSQAVRITGIILLSGVVALIGLALLAVFWMATISETPVRFRENLIGSTASALPFFTSQALASITFTLLFVRRADEFAGGQKPPHGIVTGILAGLVVSFIMILLDAFWAATDLTSSSTKSLADAISAASPSSQTTSNFFRDHNATDFIVYLLMSVAAGILVRPSRPAERAAENAGAFLHSRSEQPRWNPLAALRRLAIFCILASLVPRDGFPANDDTGSNRVLMGFRADAEPFSYLAGHKGERRYMGYIADLCYDVFDGSKYEVVTTQVGAVNRFRRLRQPDDPYFQPELGQKSVYDPGSPNYKVDIICDPTTLRYDQEILSVNGIFSPIVFVSGVSYLIRRSEAKEPDVFLGYVDGTTAIQVVRKACQVDFFGIRQGMGVDKNCTAPAVVCSGDANKVEPGGDNREKRYHICKFPTHTSLVRWFCSTPVEDRRLVYFGDSEIIHAKVQTWGTANGCPSQGIKPREAYYTYEPYALLISSKNPELVRFVQRRIYEIFSHRKKVNSLFATYFPDAQMSPIMANLFLLNAVDQESLFSAPPLEQTTATELPAVP